MSRNLSLRLVPLLWLAVICLPSMSIAEEKLSGTIYFANGTSLKFMDYVDYQITHDGPGEGERHPDIYILYQNTKRQTPMKAIKSLEITTYEHLKDRDTMDAQVEVRTRTGVTVITPHWFYRIRVKILDELTGEIKPQDVLFLDRTANGGRSLNIKRIVFD